MKKVLTVLSLIALLGMSAPAFAAPPPPPPGHGGPHHIHAGYRHDMRRPPHYHGGHYRPHSSFTIYTSFPRYNYGYRHHPFCQCPQCMAFRPFYGTGFYISF